LRYCRAKSDFFSALDFKEFWHFIGIWLLTWTILFRFLLIITLVKGSSDLLKDTIKEIDMLNMSFSLVLSAFLENRATAIPLALDGGLR